jgi:hypothetical protein
MTVGWGGDNSNYKKLKSENKIGEVLIQITFVYITTYYAYGMVSLADLQHLKGKN